MASHENDWPEPKYSPGPRQHLHALGVVSANFNVLENAMLRLFMDHLDNSDLPDAVSLYLYGELNEQKRINAIKTIFATCEDDPEVFDRIEHAVTYFNWCSHARNTLLHSLDNSMGEPEHVWRIVKRSRGDFSKLNFLVLTLPELRKTADQIRNCYDYVRGIAIYLQARGTKDWDRAPPWIKKLRPISLPEKPPVPANLKASDIPPNRII